jgi:hypothetical protein
LDDDHKRVVKSIFQFLRSQLTAQIEADAASEDAVQLLHAVRIAALDLLDEQWPVHLSGPILSFGRT